MSPLPLLLAAGLLAAGEPAAPSVAAPPSDPVAPLPSSAPRPLSLAAGPAFLRYDGIPVTLATVRAGVTALSREPDDVGGRLGVALFVEVSGGETENGLRTGGLSVGPSVVAASDRVRAALGVELGFAELWTATDGAPRLLATAALRGSLEVDLWHGASRSLFLGAAAVAARGDDLPIRGWGAYLGLR